MDRSEAAAFLERLERQAERHETFPVAGARMAWRRWGSGRPLLLLHGGGGSWMHWLRNIESFSADRSVWVPDLPGFGDSDLPREGIDADAIAPMVLAGARALLQGAAFDLVGFSFGGVVAGHMAVAPAPEIERLVLVGATGLGLLGKPPALQRMHGIQDPAARAAVLSHNLGALMIHDPARIDALALASQENGVTKEKSKGRRLAGSHVMLRLAPSWRCPAYGIWGAEDAIYRHQLPALRSTAARLGLQRMILMDGVGHWAQYEGWELFNPLLQELLAPP